MGDKDSWYKTNKTTDDKRSGKRDNGFDPRRIQSDNKLKIAGFDPRYVNYDQVRDNNIKGK
ncbi:hypothetical protein P8886_05185 [Bacillus haynesii]|uniref:hypothetical protein n=1 Tax=Bacillus haynesii TaxID=1925021 RepID=UPI002DBA3793|nr:hypothetical protein [Bacillus haynesii]